MAGYRYTRIYPDANANHQVNFDHILHNHEGVNDQNQIAPVGVNDQNQIAPVGVNDHNQGVLEDVPADVISHNNQADPVGVNDYDVGANYHIQNAPVNNINNCLVAPLSNTQYGPTLLPAYIHQNEVSTMDNVNIIYNNQGTSLENMDQNPSLENYDNLTLMAADVVDLSDAKEVLDGPSVEWTGDVGAHDEQDPRN